MMQDTPPRLVGLPILETERLTLRAPQYSDWPAFLAYRISERTAFTGGPITEQKAAEQFASFVGHWVMRGFGRLIAEDRVTGLPLGHFGPMQWQADAEVELTWSLWAAEAEGHGMATEAARAISSWAFGPLGLKTARAEVNRDNVASHAIARKLGGVVIASERPTWFDEGDVYRFSAGGIA
jgi:[ribosomal protein S5]-alanine N-acetyltransferase